MYIHEMKEQWSFFFLEKIYNNNLLSVRAY